MACKWQVSLNVMSSMSLLDFFEQMGDYPRPFSRYDGGDDDDDDDEEDGIPKIRIGICAMSKKVTEWFKHKIEIKLTLNWTVFEQD